MADNKDIVNLPNEPPERYYCLVCGGEFNRDEVLRDEDSMLEVCPQCKTGHSFGHELLPIADQTKKEVCL